MKTRAFKYFFMRGWIAILFIFISACLSAQAPNGFNPLFNGKNLKGWHVSRTTHQGTTPNFSVEKGAIVARQSPLGQGGLLLTDRKYRSFELYLEVKIDSFANGGIFLRSNEGGAAYQVELVWPGAVGNLIGERIPISVVGEATQRAQVWKPNDWNSLLIRMEGEVPKVTLWMNGVKMWEVQQPKNDFLGGDIEGMIALQCHWTATYSEAASKGMPLSSWPPNATHQYRNIAIRELTP